MVEKPTPMSSIDVYKALKGKIGDEPARLLIEYIDSAIKDNVATKQDIASLRQEMLQDIASLRAEMLQDIASLREEMLKMRVELKDEVWKLKLYLILLAVLIVITNPTVLELFGKLVGVIK